MSPADASIVTRALNLTPALLKKAKRAPCRARIVDWRQLSLCRNKMCRPVISDEGIVEREEKQLSNPPANSGRIGEDEEIIQQCIEVIRSKKEASVSLLNRRVTSPPRGSAAFARRIRELSTRRRFPRAFVFEKTGAPRRCDPSCPTGRWPRPGAARVFPGGVAADS